MFSAISGSVMLFEARRLMLAENQDATAAAFQVGYESPSQFSREYSRLFGAPPLRDIASLRQMTGTERVEEAVAGASPR
jgi:AraC-like DNA-binding protein